MSILYSPPKPDHHLVMQKEHTGCMKLTTYLPSPWVITNDRLRSAQSPICDKSYLSETRVYEPSDLTNHNLQNPRQPPMRLP